MKARVPAMALVVLTLLAVAACGGSGSLSASQLRSGATQVCTLANQRTSQIATPTSVADGLPFLQRGLGVLRPELQNLKMLKPPSGLAAVYASSLNAFSGSLTVLDQAVRGLHSGTDPLLTMKALRERLVPLETRENDGWRQLEIPACVAR
jgi:hypothetical protein